MGGSSAGGPVALSRRAGCTVVLQRGSDGWLRAVYVSKKRPYWIECRYPKDADRDSVFQHFEMAYTWIRRAARVIDDEIIGLDDKPNCSSFSNR